MENNYFTPENPQPNDNTGKTLSIIGFILSLISVICCCCLSYALVPVSVTGLILSILGRNKLAKNGESTGLAVAGIILGCIGAVFSLIFIYFEVFGEELMESFYVRFTQFAEENNVSLPDEWYDIMD